MRYVLFTKLECPRCVALKALLLRNEVPFEEKALEEPNNLDYVKGLGAKTAPVLVLNGALQPLPRLS